MPWIGGGRIEITDWTTKTASIYQNYLFNQPGDGDDMYLLLIDFYHNSYCLQSAPKESTL